MRHVITLMLMGAAAAGGEVWLGPAGGYTRAAGSTGYAETDGRDTGRLASFWGAAGGWEAEGFYLAGDVSFLPGGDDRAGLSGWGNLFKVTSYEEFNCGLHGGWRLGAGAVTPLLGAGLWWNHATYDRRDLDWWTEEDAAVALYGWSVNDLFVAPAAGAELWTEPVRWRLLVAAGYDAHHESGGKWQKSYSESEPPRKVFYEHNLARDFLAAAAALQLTWYSWGPVRVEAAFGLRGDLYQLGGGFDLEGVSGARTDVTFRLVPALVF
ncbi:MAG: hypothetical protein JSU81_10855 [Candidatus Coatesbacteria bacterium]|nr:MAG: hypothetical protein JSU81_10855 [Candidatus Coatesbacteria bacterium]